MTRHVLCLSRSYLANLLPALGKRHPDTRYFHIVQTDAEARSIAAQGGEVVLNLEAIVREGLSDSAPLWQEPADMRAVTGFSWSAIQSDRYLPHFDHATRLRIGGLLDKAVGDLFARQHFDAFVSEPVALFITHLLFYYCRRNGTRPLLWGNTYFPDYFYFADATNMSTPRREGELEAPETERLRQTVEAYVGGVVGDKAGPAYHYAFSGVKNTRLGYFKQRRGEMPLVLKPGLTSIGLQAARLGRALLKRALFPRGADFITAGSVSEHARYMRSLLTAPRIYDPLPETPSADHVVYPLQYEPEASLLYYAPEIVSQTSFVETILKALPPGKLLWVKEHPNQFGALGLKPWREIRKRHANLRFVHGRQSGRELLKRAGLCVTISSTMGMDALLIGRRVLVAGNVFFRHFPGAVALTSYAHLGEALNDPASYTPQDERAALTGHLIDFGLHAYRGDPQPSQILFEPDNLDLLVAAIDNELAGGEAHSKPGAPHRDGGS